MNSHQFQFCHQNWNQNAGLEGECWRAQEPGHVRRVKEQEISHLEEKGFKGAQDYSLSSGAGKVDILHVILHKEMR